MSDFSIIESYYRAHRDELLAYVSSRLGGDVMAAEDMVQDVFERLMQGQRPIAEVTLPSLVYTMARHQLVDHFRKLTHQRAYQSHAQAVLPSDYDIEPAVYVNDTLSHIERRLHRLPQATADIYRLHLYENMKVSEIAAHLHQDYRSVENRLGQARREVRRLLAAT